MGDLSRGRAKTHFDLTQAGDIEHELGTALQWITGSIWPCEYALNPPEGTVIDPTVAQVWYTGGDGVEYSVVYHQTTGDCTFGWRFTDTTATKVEICGETCEYIQNDPFAYAAVLVGCRSIVETP